MPFLEINGRSYKAAIFDLDGVIVDTARYHFLAWKEIAKELGIPFTEKDNERLKGVSRMASLDILLSLKDRALDDRAKAELAERKNFIYRSYLSTMDSKSLLPGASDFLLALRARNIPVALGSASKNAALVLRQTGIKELFSVVIDGTMTTKAKPDPEVFTLAASHLGIFPGDCVVFEDSQAGIEAALLSGMGAVGITCEKRLGNAGILIKDLSLAKGWIHG